ELITQHETLARTTPNLDAVLPHNDFVAVDAVGDLNAIFVQGHHMLVRGLDDGHHLLLVRIFKLNRMPLFRLKDLPGRLGLLVLAFLAVRIVEGGDLALTAWFTPEGSHPDREVPITFLKLDPDACFDLGDTQEPLIGVASVWQARQSPVRD